MNPRAQVARWGEEKPLTARVREVSASADPQTRSFLVRIDLPAQADWALGQTARVWAHGHSAPPSAWALPTPAVLKVQGQAGVWVYDEAEHSVRFQSVRVLGYRGDQVWVAEGLSAGQQVVAAGGKQAGEQLALGRQPRAVAVAAEGLGDAGDDPDFAAAIGVEVSIVRCTYGGPDDRATETPIGDGEPLERCLYQAAHDAISRLPAGEWDAPERAQAAVQDMKLLKAWVDEA